MAAKMPFCRRAPAAQIAKGRDQQFEDILWRSGRHPRSRQGALAFLPHQLQFDLVVLDGKHRLEVETTFESGAHLADTKIPGVGGGDDIETWFGKEHGVALQLALPGSPMSINPRLVAKATMARSTADA